MEWSFRRRAESANPFSSTYGGPPEDRTDEAVPAPAFLQAQLSVAQDEYRGAVSEIATRLQFEERTFGFIVALLVAIVGSQFVLRQASSADRFITNHPWILISLALGLLWFPINNVIAWADVSVAAAYINEVSVPRIRAILAAQAALEPAASRALEQSLNLIDAEWRPPLSWEPFRARHFYRRGAAAVLLTPMWVFRSLLLFAPALLVLILYVARRIDHPHVRWEVYEIALLAITVTLLSMAVIASVSVSNLRRVHG